MPKPSIKGLQKAQQQNRKMIAALQPAGALGRAIQYGTAAAHRYAVQITHVDTGALRAAHRMSIEGGKGTVFIGPGTNPKGGKPSIYGPYEFARGGEHDAYARTEAEVGDKIGEQMARIIEEAL